jgi:hypothetical protein
MTDFDETDIHAMRKQGDLRAFLREQQAAGKGRRDAKPVKVTPAVPGHRPGAWPTGTSPPGPVAPQPPEAWAAAAEEHRAWMRAGSPPGQYRCECGCTPPTDDAPRSQR